MEKNVNSAWGKTQPPHAIMTVDVEDWFHVENLKRVIPRSTWDDRDTRIVRNTSRMLELLEQESATATFFVLGWVAERYPDLIRHISEAGHEIAAHGYNHELIPTLTPTQFKQDVLRCKLILEDLTNQAVLGYRAPSFSITDWAVDCLVDLGFAYDSSSFAFAQHSRYGQLTAIKSTQAVQEIRPGFSEICISCLPSRLGSIPWGGGGYFRLLPYRLFRWGVEEITRRQDVYVFYIHPWEIDPGQPRLTGLKASEAFRHYLNLKYCERRWSLLLKEFRWISIADCFAAKKP